MNKKIGAMIVYAITALCLGQFLDALYGGEPIVHYLFLIKVATAGMILFVVACIVSLFTLRVGAICGLFASVLSWPYLVVQLSTVPWRNLAWFSRYRPDTLMSVMMLVASTLYSILLTRYQFGRKQFEA